MGMTIDEAIEMLKKDKEQRGECFISDALDMAIKALGQQPCEDTVSRQAVLDLVNSDWKYEGLETDVASLSSVQPKIKTGHWIVDKISYLGMRNGHCSNCKDFYSNDWIVMKFCPNCGAYMIEPPKEE